MSSPIDDSVRKTLFVNQPEQVKLDSPKNSPRKEIKAESPGKETVADDKVSNKDGRCWRVLKIVGIVAAAVVGVLALAALIAGIVAMIWPALAAAATGFIGAALAFVAAHAVPFVIAGAVGLGVSTAVITGLSLSEEKCCKDKDEVDETEAKSEEEVKTQDDLADLSLSTGERGIAEVESDVSTEK